MNNKDDKPTDNIVDLDTIRTLRKSSLSSQLKDSRKVADAIETHICLICNTKKMCVNKTGLCASCYDNVLTSEEKLIADNEAKHKKLKIIVSDDRWEE